MRIYASPRPFTRAEAVAVADLLADEFREDADVFPDTVECVALTQGGEWCIAISLLDTGGEYFPPAGMSELVEGFVRGTLAQLRSAARVDRPTPGPLPDDADFDPDFGASADVARLTAV